MLLLPSHIVRAANGNERKRAMKWRSRPSGVVGPAPPPANLSALETVAYYLSHWETEFTRARRTVKRRAARVTIATTLLTGAVAVLGSLSASLSDDIRIDVIGIATTAASAASAVLVAWNEHFHHRELWVQRSEMLNELQSLRMQYELLTRQHPRVGRKRDHEAKELMNRLRELLRRDLDSWANIQGGKIK